MRLAGTQWRSALRSEGRSGVFCARPTPARPAPPDPTAEPPSASSGTRSLLAGAGRGPTAPVTMVSGGGMGRGRRQGACACARSGTRLSPFHPRDDEHRGAPCCPFGDPQPEDPAWTEPCCLVATLGGPQAPPLSTDACAWCCGLYSLLSSTRMYCLQLTHRGLSHHSLTVPQPTVPRDERSDHPGKPYGPLM